MADITSHMLTYVSGDVVSQKMTDDDLRGLWDLLMTHYETSLKPLGVCAPKSLFDSRGLPRRISLQLIILFRFMGKCLHKDDISAFVRNWHPSQGDSQVRHLGTQYGWYCLNQGDLFQDQVIARGYHCLVSVDQAKPHFSPHRRGGFVAESLDDLLNHYHHSCASCGVRFGERSFRNPDQIAKMQIGHKNPHLGDGLDNIIPQCQFCNQSARDKWIFGSDGLPKCPATSEVVLSAPEEVQRMILRDLLKKFSTD